MNRQESIRILCQSGRIVVKIGSSVLTDSTGQIDTAIINSIADQCVPLATSRCWPTIVSSGSIAIGLRIMGRKERPKSMAVLQAAAAIGQSKLVETWSQAFRRHHLPVAQILLTHADLANRKRFLNARRALGAVEKCGAIAIINENDSVSCEEIAFGDNDELAALVTNLVDARLLIMLSTAPGILDKDGEVISNIVSHDSKLDEVAMPIKSNFGTGGMISKLRATRMASERGTYVAILPGKQESCLTDFLEGKNIGTYLFPSHDTPLKSRAHWIAHILRPAGHLVIDEGASQAIIENGKSLLIPGIINIAGEFTEGDAVDIRSSSGTTFARGLVGFSSKQLQRVIGLPSTALKEILDFKHRDTVVHRNDLVLLPAPDTNHS